MTIPERDTIATSLPDISVLITDDGSRTLIQNDTGDTYHSGCGALAETREVYFRNSGVADRIASQTATSVLEIGLGTAMGMLVTIDAAISAGTPLRYVAWEKDWVPACVLRPLQLERCVVNSDLVHRFIEFRDGISYPTPDGTYLWNASERSDIPCEIHFHIGDVLASLQEDTDRFDVVYFDPFAPATNAMLWESNFLRRIGNLLTTRGRLVTYCCSRAVRDAMESAGFNVERVPGPKGGKREVLIAKRSGREI